MLLQEVPPVQAAWYVALTIIVFLGSAFRLILSERVNFVMAQVWVIQQVLATESMSILCCDSHATKCSSCNQWCSCRLCML